MENASKALLIAGGVLLAMLIAMLLIFFKDRVVEFYNEQDKIDDISNISQFNKQFTNYERNNVYGYEIISLANMVQDYNTRHSNTGENDENYKPITLIIDFSTKWNDVENKIWYDKSGTEHLLKNTKKTYTQSETTNEIVGTIINKATNIENLFGVNEASKLAKSIRSLIVDDDDIEGKIQAVNTYKAIIKSNDSITYDEMKNKIFGRVDIKQYYEYYQFKKAKFDCTQVLYDNEIGGTGRISSMTFKFNGSVE